MAAIIAADISTAPVIHFERIGSTNEEALTHARRGEPLPVWVRADLQTQGRGRLGRPWESPAGNLYASLVLPIAAEGGRLPQVAHVAAVALARAIHTVTGGAPLVQIKWPNDILIDQAKVAGILVEATLTPDRQQVCVIGCGVNCRVHPDNLVYPTTDLAIECGRVIHPDELFGALRPAMAQAFADWDLGRGFAAIRAAWLDCALPRDTMLTVRTGTGQTTGRLQGMDEAGRLLLSGPAGVVAIESGDVFLCDRSATTVG